MVIEDIFAVLEECLYTVQWDGEGCDEQQRIFSQWNDPQYLSDFFNEHINDLQSGFYGSITVEQAVRQTKHEAKELQKRLFNLAKEGQAGGPANLSYLFEPISPSEMGKPLEKDKAYGTSHKSWLRIYAIRIRTNTFVICGGAIKLTETMNDREHLLKELDKLEVTRQYLEDDNDWANYFYELSL